MTITFLQPDGVAVTAQQERQAKAALYGGGAGRPLGGRSGFRVDTASTILTATSTTWTLLPCSAMIDPGAATHQGMYGWASDQNVTGAVTAADATYTRKDIVYIQVNDSSAGDGSGATTAPVLYLAGTPSATPEAPTLPARSFLVGTITVPASGGGSPTVVLNPARFVAAGGILPVYSVAERDALVKHDGLAIRRMDLTGRPTETWNGADWGGPVRYDPIDVSGYNLTGKVTVEPAGSLKRIVVAISVTRTGADASITTAFAPFGVVLPSQAIGTAEAIYLPVSLTGGTNNVHATVFLNPADGAMSIRGQASFTWSTGALFSLNCTYYI